MMEIRCPVDAKHKLSMWTTGQKKVHLQHGAIYQMLHSYTTYIRDLQTQISTLVNTLVFNSADFFQNK